ncbi:hypothetical protein [Actibacterium sp. XHP0104]|uniref:LuxE/PaaK family acyltransferase n=1 Tax=Actibacterium sp. XHP0104 TaxID=2984335 RepID=UPI0021E8D85B|nr:hypothetical protein [Actibacterium sp. XHP0104]MCV2881300.1 hypothetical protein [Actibacterium sp. XHP0104]
MTDNLSDLQTGLGLIKMANGAVSKLFQLPPEDLAALQFEMIKRSFRYHFDNNEFYQDVARCADFTPDQLNTEADLLRLPLIPVSAYKGADSHRLLTVPLTEVEHEMRSTGTSGVPSVARRCRDTVDGGVLSVFGMYREFLGISKGAGLYLCPSTEEIPEMGMIKALNMLAGLLDTHRFMVRNEQMVPEDAVAQLRDWDSFTRHIIGPPFLIHRFISYLKATNTRIQLDPGSQIITLGGWKRFTGAMISRVEFNQECREWLGVEPRNIRDIYALVESNIVAIEDEHGIKHVTPTARISVRDPENLGQEVPMGKPGQLAIYDPTNFTVPGFLLTEDIVTLEPRREGDPRAGQRMKYLMRAPTSSEFGCCAVNLEKKMDSEPA